MGNISSEHQEQEKKYHERVSTIADNRKEAILVTSTTRFGKM
jgi:hypothetical protein